MVDKEHAREPFLPDKKRNIDAENGAPNYLMSCRFKFGVIVFAANMLCYLHRVNLNMAIVCMLGTSGQPGPNKNLTVTIDNSTGINPSIHESFQIVSNAAEHLQDSKLLNLTYRNNQNLGLPLENKDAGIESTSISYSKTETVSAGSNNLSMDDVPDNSDLVVLSEFNWDKAEISLILSSYYYGSVITQIPAGYLAHHFGGKHVISVFFIISGACSLLAPIAAQTSTALIFVIRILIGLAGGFFTPAIYSITMNWTKPSQRAALLSVMISGQPLGIVVAYMTSGFLCAFGWSTIFYVHGALTFLVLLLWLYEIHSSPTEHPRISQAELTYLTRHLSTKTPSKAVPATPWKSILLSRPQWAATLAHFSFNWSYYTFIINIPLFLKEVFAFVITENGLYSSIPYIFCSISMMFSGKLSAIVVKKRWLTLQATRKVFNVISLGGIAVCLLGAGQLTHEFRFLAVILICISCIFVGFTFGGVIPSYADFAGIFSGTAFSIGNAIGVISVVLSALSAGLLTLNGLRHEWQNVFYVAAGMNVFSIIVYSLFGEATLQKWAIVQDFNTVDEIEVALGKADSEKEIDVSLGNGHLEMLKSEIETSSVS
ncbi:sialin-like [Mercenaria mercenaria]|uniref:sialin-like n=1 Tax=Mercenaria mercenaria TaxID=6596 RepID=UPI00234EABC3|nr:sialin-like [Mercenaria mercenaria]